MKTDRKKIFLILMLFVSFIAVSIPLYFSVSGSNFIFEEWGLISILIISFAIIAVIIDFKDQILSSKAITLITVLGTLTAILRVPFILIPNIQPCTFLIICTGIAFGPAIGFLVGILTPLISNLFLGHGPWTLLQMYAWGIIGGVSGLFAFNPKINRWKLGVIGVFFGYLFGFIMNLWFWYTYLYPPTLFTFILAEAQGLPFDSLHAIGNFTFLVILGNKTLKVFTVFKKYFV